MTLASTNNLTRDILPEASGGGIQIKLTKERGVAACLSFLTTLVSEIQTILGWLDGRRETHQTGIELLDEYTEYP